MKRIFDYVKDKSNVHLYLNLIAYSTLSLSRQKEMSFFL